MRYELVVVFESSTNYSDCWPKLSVCLETRVPMTHGLLLFLHLLRSRYTKETSKWLNRCQIEHFFVPFFPRMMVKSKTENGLQWLSRLNGLETAHSALLNRWELLQRTFASRKRFTNFAENSEIKTASRSIPLSLMGKMLFSLKTSPQRKSITLWAWASYRRGVKENCYKALVGDTS